MKNRKDWEAVGGWPLLFRASRFEVRESPPGPGGVRREVVIHPGSAVVVPELAPGRLLLIRNWRVSAGGPLLEFPAGTMEPGEAPRECGARELQEETGYRAAEIRELGRVFSAPGISTEVMHLFLARGLQFVGQELDPGEEITTVEMGLDQLLTMAQQGEIQDAKTLCGLALYLWRSP